MNRRGPFPLKEAGLWFGVVILGGGISFVIFLAAISINIGLQNLHQDGFMVPVLAGVVSIAVCLLLFICIMKLVFSIRKEKHFFISRM
jgi:hypothetical protein